MKVLIVGGVAGGASTAARLRRLDEHAEIIIFERGKNISFANCGIPYYCGDVIKEREKLEVLTPKKLKEILNVEARTESEVLRINPDEKSITILDKTTNDEYVEYYDKLVLSPGAYPVKPPLNGIDNDRTFTVRNLEDADNIKNFINNNFPKSAVVIGAGFIGLEMAENLAHQGIKVTVIEKADQILSQLDYEMAAQIQNHIKSKGINLVLNTGVSSFRSSDILEIFLENGEIIKADFAVLSIGVKPEVKLAQEAGLSLGSTGGILVNERMQTTNEYIYALGDAVQISDFTNNFTMIPLANLANRQGRVVADNICDIDTRFKLAVGTAIVKIFDYTAAVSGYNEKQLQRKNIPYLRTVVQGFSHAGYYPMAFPLSIKLLFSPDNGKILGAQVIGLEGVDKRIDVLATAIKFKRSVQDLIDLELAYAPPYGSAKDPVNMAGMVAENILTGKVKTISWQEFDSLQADSVILDVRTMEEQVIGKLSGAYNIPLKELRERINEIPRDRRIIVLCNKGMNAYFAARVLMQNGFDNVYSLDGGYSLYKAVVKPSAEPVKLEHKLDAVKETVSVSYSSKIKIDACGLQCPGPILRLAKEMENIDGGETLEITTTDPGFKADVQAWCDSTGNVLIDLNEENKIISARILKGKEHSENPELLNEKNNKTLVVFSNDLDKAMASFIIANGAAATGKPVTMFFTFWGLNILRKSENVPVEKGILDKMFGFMMPKGAGKLSLSKMHMFGMGTGMMKYVMQQKNVSTLQDLIAQAKAQGVRFIACNMSMDVMGIKPEELIDGIEIGGVATYIASAEKSDMNLFI